MFARSLSDEADDRVYNTDTAALQPFLIHLNCQFKPRICKHLLPDLFKNNFKLTKSAQWEVPNLHRQQPNRTEL